ncbi:unnamed protein product [Fraxinus pennsylvanica]|uniref:Oxidoreductase FAD/NAD(P)-binding domain-containing protein n=1 Tax=Fraxinus pennsylvanica TaxID=56036 RepID=A0AAD2A7M4_9LAMI|nr:unnamed protein product [Fraxinus pennsylvanica]
MEMFFKRLSKAAPIAFGSTNFRFPFGALQRGTGYPSEVQNYMKWRYVHKVRFYNTLVIGYAVAGKSEVALELFGRMRFQGVDLDAFAYHVLLNSLVEEGYFDVVEMVAKQIRVRAIQNEVTHSIMMRSFCKQNELERAENYLRGLVGDNGMGLSGVAVGIFVDALCKDNQFEKAALLIEEFHKMNLVSMEYAYSVWIRDLVKAGKLDGALEFLNDKQSVEGYVPDVFRYSSLICRLLMENRLIEVCDLLMEMKWRGILPDDVTMNATLCFLCKARMMDVAMDLYDSRAEFGLLVSCMAYNYLINTLVGDGTVDEAYRVEGKLDKMKELVLVALDQNIMPNDLTYDKFISSLYRAKRVEDGYLVYLDQLNEDASPKVALNPNKWFEFKLQDKAQVSHNSQLFRFSFDPAAKLGLDVASCIIITRSHRSLPFQLVLHLQCNLNSLFHAKVAPAGQNPEGKPKYVIRPPIEKLRYNPNMKKHIGMIAGGSGISPMLQIIDAILKNPDDNTQVTLLYANVFYTVDNPTKDWHGGTGYIANDMVKKGLPGPGDDTLILVCGPPGMMKNISGDTAPDWSQGEVLGYTETMVYKF